jgi:hypothetical protein
MARIEGIDRITYGADDLVACKRSLIAHDLREVIGGGLHMARFAWETRLGPARHPISSASHRFFERPAGALVEHYADEDVLTENGQPRDFELKSEMFAEWATGGLDGNPRRQKPVAKAGS